MLYMGDFEQVFDRRDAFTRLIQAIYAGLKKSWSILRCGAALPVGQEFLCPVLSEVSDYYGKECSRMEMIEFLQCLKQCWKTHGWGTFDPDVLHQQGF